MKTLDLHDEFISALYGKESRRADLTNKVSDILLIEKESASRRLSGKVNFSIREMGILASRLNISLDRLLHKDQEGMMLPFIPEYPLKVHSMDSLFEMVSECLRRMENILTEPAETGNVYHSLPMEFYMFSPVMTKFMFFKWGHYFVGTEEFNNFSRWELPDAVARLSERLWSCYKFEKAYYIWDESLISNLAKEIASFHRMHVITTEEKDEIKYALKEILTKLEMALNGTYTPKIQSKDTAFYVSTMHLGFTSNYFLSENNHSLTFQTNFSFSMIEDSPESFQRMKKWIDSFRSISVLLSQSGRIERRLFFESQHNLIDYMLG